MRKSVPIMLVGLAVLVAGFVTGCQRGAAPTPSNQTNTAANPSTQQNQQPKTDKAKAAQLAGEFLVTVSSANYKDVSSFTAAEKYAGPALASLIDRERKATEQQWLQKKYYEQPGQPKVTFLGMNGKDWIFQVSVPVVAYQDPGEQMVDSQTVTDDLQVTKTSSGTFQVVDAVNMTPPNTSANTTSTSG